MNDITLIEAWRIWFSGDLADDILLWGISILWWERIGKLMQVVGAVTILAEIIGPQRIRELGTSLQSQNAIATLKTFLRQCFGWYGVVFRRTILKDFPHRSAPETQHRRGNLQLDLLNVLICLLLTAVIVYLTEAYLVSSMGVLARSAIIFGCLWVSVAPLVTVIAVISGAMLGLAMNTCFIQPIAGLLENPSLDHYIKIASLVSLLVGFHFELLAS